ncbi:hypothetical protein CL656_04285 [bacterium]|nr:hypothetical protein [bacterium]|tara:strand:- start:5728 stop:6207 length:480 start_codon:yes stop_codon:yes gene_type:complete
MEKKEILIPISKIRGLDKITNSLDFQVEKVSTTNKSSSVDVNINDDFDLQSMDKEEDLHVGDINFKKSNFNIDIKEIPSVEDKYLKINLKSFLDMIDSANLESDLLDGQEVVVNSKFLMSLINSKDPIDLDDSTSNQLMKGVLIGVLVSIFLFLFIKLI